MLQDPQDSSKSPPDKDVIAMVGAGKGGRAILGVLLRIPGITVRHVFDTNPDAPGIVLAREKGIACRTDGRYDELKDNPDINLIFEVTGKQEVFDKLREIKHVRTSLIGSIGTRIIFHLLDTQRKTAERLEAYKEKLEQRIIQRTEEIEKANKSLEMKILDYERLTQELVKVNEDKTRYLLQATHQLKAPFAAIQSYTDIILDGYTGEVGEQTRDIVHKIRIRCQMLSDAIKDMLELANLQSVDRDNLPMADESVNEILFQAIEQHTVIANQHQIRFAFKPLEGGDTIHCHKRQVRTLFSALLENAVNYSPNNSVVEILFEKRGPRKLSVLVRDHGIGIAEENLTRIFKEYFRANEAVRKHENGTGLGLSIAQEVAKIHGFTLDVESQPGQGSTFTVTMPLAAP